MTQTQSIREIINKTEELGVGDKVRFTDEEGVTHEGEIVEFQPFNNTQHKDWLVKTTSDTPDSALELWFDPEGGPIHVIASFETQASRNITHIEKTN